MIYTVTLNPALVLELTVPEFAFDQVLRACPARADCGGKGFNVARALVAGLLWGLSRQLLMAEALGLGVAWGRVNRSNGWRKGCGSSAWVRFVPRHAGRCTGTE